MGDQTSTETQLSCGGATVTQPLSSRQTDERPERVLSLSKVEDDNKTEVVKEKTSEEGQKTPLKRPSNDITDDEADEPEDSPGQPKRKRRTPLSGDKHHRRGKKRSDRSKKSKSTNAAPFNSTQFIMNDHSDTIQYLDQKLGVTPDEFLVLQSGDGPAAARPRKRASRARSYSFALESDDDYFYSSPEDEEEFVSKEFLKDYNNVRADRLVTMSKGDLINEYLQMEARVDALEKRLERVRQREEARKHEVDYDFSRGEVPMEPEVAEKIRIFQKEIHSLKVENHGMRLELVDMRRQRQHKVLEEVAEEPGAVSSSSSDSSSDSSSSDSSSSSSSDDEDNDDDSAVQPNKTQGDAEEPAQDTGYDSEQSGSLPQQGQSGSAEALKSLDAGSNVTFKEAEVVTSTSS